jgi:hypothetical protein
MLKRTKELSVRTEMENNKLQKQVVELQGLISINEDARKNFSNMLQKEKVNNEKSNNKIIELNHLNSLLNLESDILGDQLKRVYDAIKSVGVVKEVEDKFNM